MNYQQFAKEKPVLFGQITVNGKSKIGQFKPMWNRHTNSIEYRYHSPNGNKGTGGFTLKGAFMLLQIDRLSVNPENGNPANYI